MAQAYQLYARPRFRNADELATAPPPWDNRTLMAPKVKTIDRVLGVLNGAVGDYLVRTGNQLAMPMTIRTTDAPFEVTPAAMRAALPHPSSRIVLLLHGQMATEADWKMPPPDARDGSDGNDDYGSLLARDLGVTPLYVRYNSGSAIASTGAELAALITELVAAYPIAVEEIILLGHSMGGLILRSACHIAHEQALPWLSLVHRSIYLGTPHLGAPLERAGRVATRLLRKINDPTTRLIGEIFDLRSDGIRDLGNADLRQEDRIADRTGYALTDPHHPVPLLTSIDHLLIAGAMTKLPWVAAMFGDGVVPLTSATLGSWQQPWTTGAHPVATSTTRNGILASNVRILPNAVHAGLAHNREAYPLILQWLTS